MSSVDKEFFSEDYARGFMEGLEYCNDSAITHSDLKRVATGSVVKWVVTFEDTDTDTEEDTQAAVLKSVQLELAKLNINATVEYKEWSVVLRVVENDGRRNTFYFDDDGAFKIVKSTVQNPELTIESPAVELAAWVDSVLNALAKEWSK